MAKTPDLKHLDKTLRTASVDVRSRDRVLPHPAATAERPTLSTLLRLGGWGFCMALALGVTVTVARTDRGVERIEQVFAGLHGPAKPAASTQVAQTRPDPEIETRRLAAQIQILKADREKLVTRVAALERNLDDVTGSVKQTVERIAAARELDPENDDSAANSPDETGGGDTLGRAADRPEKPRAALRELTPLPRTVPAPSAPAVTDAGGATPVPLVAHPTVVATTPPISTAGMPMSLTAMTSGDNSAKAPARPAAAASLARLETTRGVTTPDDSKRHNSPEARTPTRLDYGIDLGGASTVEALRSLWATTKAEHAPLLDRLQPAVVLRPTGKGGAPQLRLMAGPFADAGSAATICKTFVAGRGVCRPFAFDGQKLPLH
jgi:hypothetical protein